MWRWRLWRSRQDPADCTSTTLDLAWASLHVSPFSLRPLCGFYWTVSSLLKFLEKPFSRSVPPDDLMAALSLSLHSKRKVRGRSLPRSLKVNRPTIASKATATPAKRRIYFAL